MKYQASFRAKTYLHKNNMLLSRVKKPVAVVTFRSESLIVRYFIGVDKINRTSRGRLERIRNFSSCVEKNFTLVRGAHS